MMIDTAKLRPSNCPSCGLDLLEACKVASNKKMPTPGDMGICSQCGEIFIFGPTLDIREPTLTELLALPKQMSDAIDLAQRLIRKVRPH